MKQPYKFIAIEGNIGAGKSTLARILSQRMDAVYLPEHFEDNPFLSSFYNDPARYSLQVELSFLEERYRHIRNAMKNEGPMISDYLWEKSLVFGKINLKGEELKLFERIFHLLANQLRVPDLVIYLHRPPEKLLKQINLRGREYERNIPSEYLGKVGAGYSAFFSAEKRMPVLWIDNDLGPEALAQHVLNLSSRKFSNGLQYNP
ncbi:MAG TPA: deoxynucleoside kinase [Bacteroidia bacterium]|jgi:deoxyadenosine/deoxycytidine kinase|nr:deoxynucleoside kinase [Bacteroidia bacterium]